MQVIDGCEVYSLSRGVDCRVKIRNLSFRTEPLIMKLSKNRQMIRIDLRQGCYAHGLCHSSYGGVQVIDRATNFEFCHDAIIQQAIEKSNVLEVVEREIVHYPDRNCYSIVQILGMASREPESVKKARD